MRSSKAFFELEEYLMTRKGELVSQIKALYKGYKQRIRYSQMKAAGNNLSSENKILLNNLIYQLKYQLL